MPTLLSTKTKKTIVRLRKHGWSLPEIKKKINVGYGSIFRYTKNVEILPQFNKTWLGKRGGSIKRMWKQEKYAQEKANKMIKSLSIKEKIILLSALYWGEGSKNDFSFINSDPNFIKVFIIGLKELFKISDDRLSITIRIYEDMNQEECKIYWAQITGVRNIDLIKINVLKGKKQGKLKFGLCRVRVKKGGDLLKYIKAIKDQIVIRFCSRSSTDRTGAS